MRASEVVIPSEARDLQLVKYRSLASLGMTIALLVSSSVSPAFAQPLRGDSIWMFDARVVEVISGGTWTDKNQTGQYRIVVRNDGTDLVHYTTVVQWMMRRGLQQDLELVRTLELTSVAKRWYSILGPELRYARGRWILTVDAADGPTRVAKHRPQFILGPPGVITAR